MKKPTLKSYAAALAVDALLVALAVLWQRDGVDGAGGAFQALSWAVAAITLLASLAHWEDKDMPLTAHGPLWRVYSWARILVKLVAYPWMGLFWLFGLYVVAQVVYHAARREATRASRN